MHIISEHIEAIRKDWGKRLLIVGHQYQNPTVLRHVDAIGDSLELARRAAAETEAERIVFCGVHFMAESADILTGAARRVYMPDTQAGCPMAAMAQVGAVEAAWATLQASGGDWLPVVYVNSTAAVKALCGRWGGSACTSSNAEKVMRWVFASGKRVFFLPDEHLGTNTAHDLGLADEEVAVYDPGLPSGGLTADHLGRVRVVVWKGHCIIHTRFTVEHIRQARANWPDARIIVHPETPKEVVRLADAHGSTSQIIRYVEEAPDGATILIGTEARLVERLAALHKDRLTIKVLSFSCCANMARTNESNLCALLTDWPDQNRVHVSEDLAADARLALDRMIRL